MPLRATSFDLNPVEAGLFSTVSHSRLVIGTLREKPSHQENNHPEIVAPPWNGQPREHLLPLPTLLFALSSPRIFLSPLIPSNPGASLFPLFSFRFAPDRHRRPRGKYPSRESGKIARRSRFFFSSLPVSPFCPFRLPDGQHRIRTECRLPIIRVRVIVDWKV